MTIGQMGENLIFIFSQPRSGSTLLQRILAGHPDVYTTAEPWFLLHPLYALRTNGIHTEYDHTLANRALVTFLNNIPDGIDTYRDSIRGMALTMYNSALASSTKTHFVDKTPRYYYITEDIVNLFPAAKYILLFRNPAAILASVLNTHVQGYWPLLSRYKDDLLLAPRKLTLIKDALRDRSLSIQYEELVQNPEIVIKNVCDYLAIPFLPEIINYGYSKIPAGSMGDQTEINRLHRPNPHRLNNWKELSSDFQANHFAVTYLSELGNEIINRMGYDYQAILQDLSHEDREQDLPKTTWQELMHPDKSQEVRLQYAELAILEHRRIVFRLKRFVRHLFSS